MAVTHVAYEQVAYRHPEECIKGIQDHVRYGWQISDLRGPRRGPFVVIFRMEDDAHDRDR